MWFINNEDRDKREVVSCEKCKCLLVKEDAQEVRSNIYTDYFCQEHKTKYNRKYFTLGCGADNNTIKYYKEFEVDENGNLLKTKNK